MIRRTNLAVRSWAGLLVLPLALLLLAVPATAQKIGRTWHEDPVNGFRFKYPHEWAVVPVQPQYARYGMQAQMDGKRESTRMIDLRSGKEVTGIATPDVLIFAFQTRDAEEGDEGRTTSRRAREDIGDVIDRLMGHFKGFDKAKPDEDKTRKIKGIEVRRRTWRPYTGQYDIVLDTWTFQLEDRDICLLFRVAAQHEKKYLKVFERCAKTFEEIERKSVATLTDDADYDSFLAYHAQEAERIPGWRVLPTPSQQFIIKTSSDDDRFLNEVIGRLEKSRAIFEIDFPPAEPIEAVSVVRVCKDAEEFRSYGNVPRGVAGFFSPRTKELVLYDDVAVDRNATYATMTHEAFHQYCHYLFGESEAHRWFDEGHGDYYGGMKFTPRKAVITARMPAGLNRLEHVRELVRNETFHPISKHINYSHREWQRQGPINVSCYSQSWSIIYMLRQGSLGKVPKKVWRDEYANIIPNYIQTLNDGFEQAYADLREELIAEAEEAEEELTEDDLEFDSTDLDVGTKKEIWEAAIAASWGQIDIDTFEEHWKVYVKKYLKD